MHYLYLEIPINLPPGWTIRIEDGKPRLRVETGNLHDSSVAGLKESFERAAAEAARGVDRNAW